MAYGYAPRSGDAGFGLSVPNFDTWAATSLTTVEDLALWDENFYTAGWLVEPLVRQLQERGSPNDGTQLSHAAGLEIGKYRGLNIASAMPAGMPVTGLTFDTVSGSAFFGSCPVQSGKHQSECIEPTGRRHLPRTFIEGPRTVGCRPGAVATA